MTDQIRNAAQVDPKPIPKALSGLHDTAATALGLADSLQSALEPVLASPNPAPDDTAKPPVQEGVLGSIRVASSSVQSTVDILQDIIERLEL